MAFFRRAVRAVTNLFLVAQTPQADPQPVKRSAADAFENEADHEASQRVKRSKALDDTADLISYHEAVDSHNSSPSLISCEKTATTSAVSQAVQTKAEARAHDDRTLMPPPSVTVDPAKTRQKLSQKVPRKSLDLSESASQATRSTRTGRADVVDEYNMEEARRKAAATQLPPNSGIWEKAERELFFHLSYRGFEPLISKSWMIDFPTLPLSVFAHQADETPLIECHRSTEFRGIRALRELFDTGTAVRDHTLSVSNGHREPRAEPILEKATKRYIQWALKDLGLPKKFSGVSIPVYSIASRKPGMSTDNVIRKLATEMHVLAAKHNEVAAIYPDGSMQEKEALENDIGAENHELEDGFIESTPPVIYGIMIVSSIVAIFTLNSHVPFPRHLIRNLLEERKSTHLSSKTSSPSHVVSSDVEAALLARLEAQLDGEDQSEREDLHEDEDSGIRFIASFDFSDAASDVWNAFVVAIVAIQIREAQSELYESWKSRDAEVQQEIARAQHAPAKQSLDKLDRSTPLRGHGKVLDPATPYSNGDRSNADAGEDSWLSNVDGIASPYTAPVPALLLAHNRSGSDGTVDGRNSRSSKVDQSDRADSLDPDL